GRRRRSRRPISIRSLMVARISATARQPWLGRRTVREMVGARGFEPPTSRSRTVRATRLRYAPTRRALLYRVVGPAQGRQVSQAYLPTSLTNLHSPQRRVFIPPRTFSTTVRAWFATSPTRTPIHPPPASCWKTGRGAAG